MGEDKKTQFQEEKIPDKTTSRRICKFHYCLLNPLELPHLTREKNTKRGLCVLCSETKVNFNTFLYEIYIQIGNLGSDKQFR